MNKNNVVCTNLCLELKDQLIRLLDDLIEICPNEPDILKIRFFFEHFTDSEKVMGEFVTWVLPWKTQIKNQDESYFDKNDHIFGPLPADKVQYFKKLYRSGILDNEDKKVIWDYLNVFIELSEKYRKLK